MQLPECRNPDHIGPKNTMACAEERQDCFIFYCTTCKDRGIQSVQVKTRAYLRDASRRELARKNQLLKAPPPRMKQINMDSALREEMIDRQRFELNRK